MGLMRAISRAPGALTVGGTANLSPRSVRAPPSAGTTHHLQRRAAGGARREN